MHLSETSTRRLVSAHAFWLLPCLALGWVSSVQAKPTAGLPVCLASVAAAGSPMLLAQAGPAEGPLMLGAPGQDLSAAPAVAPSLGLKFDPALDLEPSLASDTPVYIFGRRISGQTDDYLNAQGDAEFRRLGMFIKAENLNHNLIQNELTAQGDVKLFREGEYYEGLKLRLKLGTSQGSFESVNYELISMGTRGSATRVEFVQPMETKLTNATFTSCPRDRPAWELRMSELVVDQIREVGLSQSTYLYWKDTPILPMGNMSFATGNRRKTGFLAPSYATTSRLGLEIQTPFYWNIAPNHDLTLYPKIITRRGIQLGSEFRYLTPTGAGTVAYEILPSDRVEKTTRQFGRITASQQVNANWTLGINAARASDDRYFSDFGTSLLGASQRILPAMVSLNGTHRQWQTNVQVQQYQLLQDANAPLLQPYSMLPRVGISRSHRANAREQRPIDWNFSAEATSFRHPTLAQGERFVSKGDIAYRHVLGGIHLTPKLSLHAAHFVRGRDGDFDETQGKYGFTCSDPSKCGPLGTYQNNVDATTKSYTRVLPTFGFNVSTVFERATTLGGVAMEQTLEPRISYQRTPFKNQDKYPVFDTGVQSADFAQIFSETPFNGDDRIADLNQLTVGLTTRYIQNTTGIEQLRASLAQRFYFSDQQVTLPGQSARTDRRSDLLGQLSTKINPWWSLEAQMRYTVSINELKSGNLITRYSPRPGRAVSAAYRYVRDSSNTIDLAFQWPVARHWYAVGRYNYAFKNSNLNATDPLALRSGEVESLAGFEYDGGCWVGRVVFQRFVTGERERNTALFFQIELNGLARVGTNPLSALTRSIPNYQMINQLTPMPAKFDNFQ